MTSDKEIATLPRNFMKIRIPALKVHQWLPEWDKVSWDDHQYRSTPPKNFMVLSMKAGDLRRLSAIYRRQAEGTPRTEDLGIQRRHDKKRSENIKQFVKYGYPYCDLTKHNQESGEHETLRKPGWLPTGIVINILKAGDTRMGKAVEADDLIDIVDMSDKLAELSYSESMAAEDWAPSGIAPVEVIDGQHRLWAFDDSDFAPDFEMPVIAFHGLDISWQAYLFWSINIKPVKINTSLAFDMYPLLRAEDWLEKEGHKVYKEARAQELVETLWIHPDSPWKNRIDMLATPNNPYVRQAAWIRTIISSFIKPVDARKSSGGLFGEIKNANSEVLPWNRSQQAAFLIYVGKELYSEIRKSDADWANKLREDCPADMLDPKFEPAMFGKKTFLNTDQGIRALWLVVNDIFISHLAEWKLYEWHPVDEYGNCSEEVISKELQNIASLPVSQVIQNLTRSLATFDWRTSTAPGLEKDQISLRKGFKGSGGYVDLKRLILEHIAEDAVATEISEAAAAVLKF
jgi:hypothetical protein